ncbi:MAG TPA: hypothetical protein VM733_19915, partial [Thermoanaerobaculia bacterium]|nr:hypothetical protein [Thermoanaerobaculia bacterium]
RTLTRGEAAQRLAEPRPQARWRGDGREPVPHECAQLAMDDDADLAVRTVAHVNLDIDFFLIAERSVEEEVNNSFYIVTEHSWIPSVGER